MATLLEIARATTLSGPALAHVQRLVASWGMLADLCFADLLLFAPRAGGTASGADGASEFLIVGQVRPTTSQTLYRDDQVGRAVAGAQRPEVAKAFELAETIHAELSSPIHEVADVECIPVRYGNKVVAILTRESAPSVGRRPGELERVYVELFDRFAGMIAAGEFPFDAEDPEPDEAPRVGDGVARLDAHTRVDFASPNFVSAVHRMGVHSNLRGARLADIAVDDSVVRAAFATGRSATGELERNEVTVLIRCIPLVERGKVTGAVAMIRDVSDLRRRDRLLTSMDVTIREIHHRVKNNLQTISSLLRLQARRLASAEAREALEDAEARIRSIALVHETLSASGAGQEVDFDEIVRPLVRRVEEGLVSPERRVRLLVEGNAGPLPAEVATPLAVVLTELLQNAVRHGFPEDGPAHSVAEDGDGAWTAGTVRVSLGNAGGELTVRVVDDGVGLPGELKPDEASLGLTIVRTLVGELGGRLVMASEGRGTTAELHIPLSP